MEQPNDLADSPPRWLVDLVREFSPKVVPLDVTPEGTYEEAATRWGMNPVYEAVPPEIRLEAERTEAGDARAYWAELRKSRGED